MAAYRALPQTKSIAGVLVVWAVGLAVVMALFVSAGSGLDDRTFLVLATALIVGIAAFIGVRRGRRQWAKRALVDTAGEGASEMTFSIDEGGFSIDSALRQHRLSWSAMHRCIETADTFIVFTSSQTVQVVPKRAFATADLPKVQRMFGERIQSRPLVGTAFGKRILIWWFVLIAAFLAVWQCLSGSAERADEPGDKASPYAN